VELAKSYSRDHRIMILSDEAYRPLRYEGEDLPSMTSADADSETVIAAGTFSKSFSPGIRVGWGVMPQTVIESITALKNNMDFGAPNLNQCIVHRAMESGVYDTHVESLQHAYRLKRDAMLAAADEYLGDIPGVSWRRPQGGLYIWLTLPAEMPSSPGSPLFDLAVKRGVLYVPGQYCFPKCGVPVAENTIRLSFGVEQPERLRDGMRLLSECIREILHI
jgi:2-aminoadipate transaminase